MSKSNLDKYVKILKGKSAFEVVLWAVSEFGKDKVALASSLGAEDQVLTHMLSEGEKTARIFTLDTGRLFSETYETMQRTMEKYDIRYESISPNSAALAELTKDKGPNLFYLGVPERKACCEVRKQQPLKKVLGTLDAWICGLWNEQAATRQNVEVISWDEQHGLFKICPLFDWNEERVWTYIKEKKAPYNPLHDKGFRSIGCAPCTRAVSPGEDFRAGRWWWESSANKECGLHQPSGSSPQEKNK